MDLQLLKRERKVCRSSFTRSRNRFLERCDTAEDFDGMKVTFDILKEKANQLFDIEEKVRRRWLEKLEDENIKEFEDDCDTADEYRYSWGEAKLKYDRLCPNDARPDSESRYEDPTISSRERNIMSGSGSEVSTVRSSKHTASVKSNHTDYESKRKFVLPKIQLIQFDGKIKNWLSFWGQFKRIDEAVDIDIDDKFQYLIQATLPNSPARDLVESFPPSGENYRAAVEQLKGRFARDDLLIEIYVRELLNLVLTQSQNPEKTSSALSTLYDKLNTQLRALQSLGVTSDRYAAMLYPLVESALPDDVLRAWERSRGQAVNTADDLRSLLDFIKREVESEERINISRSGISGIDSTEHLGTKQPTASCLVSTEPKGDVKSNMCIWCEKTHNSLECFKAARMTLEERKEFLLKKGVCFICLKMNHTAKQCKSFARCIFCGRRHSVLLCTGTETQDKNKTTDEKPTINSTQNQAITENNISPKNNTTTLLQTLMVKIEHEGKTLTTRAFLDSGSQRSYVRRDIVKSLGIAPADRVSLAHSLFGGIETDKEDYGIYNFNVQSPDNEFEFQMTALDKTKVCGVIPRLLENDRLMVQLQENAITLSDKGRNSPDIGLLIGADYSGMLLTGCYIQLEDNLTAIKTKLGWTVQGRKTIGCSNIEYLINNNITDLWELEVMGIRDPIEIKSKKEQQEEILNYFEDTVTTKENGRYEVNLPWKTGHSKLESNRDMAIKRLEITTKKLMQTENYNEYDNVFKDWLKEGIIDIVEEDNMDGNYLAHRAVIKESSLTTRVRPVFDASARDRNGNSLNSCLETGINLLELIPNLLLQFRKHAIGITSDIRKAFLQISLASRDREYLKFLWWRNEENRAIITYRHCRVVFGLTSSPFLLNATIVHHLNRAPDSLRDTANKLKNSFYVDNCVTSLETEQEVDKFITEAKTLMSAACFDLRLWETAPYKHDKTEETQIVSVLGLLWDKNTDELFCNISESQNDDVKMTKRSLLSIAQRVFDPVGYTCPTTLIPKLLLQKACKENCGWDDQLPEHVKKSFSKWLENVHYLKQCRIPRRITEEAVKDCECSLHTFCDSSKGSYAVCIFLRAVNRQTGQISVRLVTAKARVAPLREVTIPRLELLAAVIAVRLYQQVEGALKLCCRCLFWTDSSVVLTWIKRDANWSVFVKNRVKEIRCATNPDNWYHVPGTANPADLPSRGCDAKVLVQTNWWEGPEWLKLSEDKWPKLDYVVNELEIAKEEKKTVCIHTINEKEDFLGGLTHFSKYTQIVRVMAWLMRFIHNAKYSSDKNKGELSCDEYEYAERLLLKLIQSETYINSDMKIMKEMHTIRDKEGLIRLKTKLLLSEEDNDFMWPILLPGNNEIIKRLIRQKHIQLQHAGTNTLICELRNTYWITGIRKIAKRTRSDCMICKRFSVKPEDTPVAPLPKERVANTAAFEVTGVDLAGPLYLKGNTKCWIVLYTCAVYRGIHLELTKSLSTEAFLMTFRRFIARRGRPRIIMSDNGTNFVGTDNLFREIDWNEVERVSTVQRIKWKFNVPSAPWWGGYWERLIRMVKELLRRVLGKSVVTYVELETILCDCEAVINSRPLTYMAEGDRNENLRPLTPRCFMQSLSSNETHDIDQVDAKSLNNRMRYLQKLRVDLRQRFRSEYLGMLVHRGPSRISNIQVGDVVLLETEKKRLFWPLAVVEELYAGRDGIPRVARVRTADSEYKRPLQRLYQLEVQNSVLVSGGC